MTARQINTVIDRLHRALGEQSLTRLGFETGFTRRLREVTPQRLALSLVGTLATQRVKTLADLLRSFNALTGRCVRYKPFHNQLAKPTFPAFMKALLAKLLAHLTLRVLAPLPGSALRAFTDIVIHDGSSFAVKDALQEHFPGRFTALKPAAVEIHATVSLFRDQLVRVTVAPDAWPERGFLPAPDSLRGQLLLADRGYCSLDIFRQVAEAGGHFLVRVRRDLNPWIRECWIADRRCRKLEGRRLRDVLGKLKGCTADLLVDSGTGGHRLRHRLVLAWSPKAKQHLRLATNVAASLLDAEGVRSLYRLRWQVELLFKEWKSYANLHVFGTRKPGIAEGLIWASLAAAALKRYLAHATQLVFRGAETSTRIVAMSLAHHLPPLVRAFLHGRGMACRARDLLEYLAANAGRAHPKRDRHEGRLRLGLRPLALDAALRFCPVKN